jgi:hypothetical protein
MPVVKWRWSIFNPHPEAKPEDKAELRRRDFEEIFGNAKGARVLAEILRMADITLAAPPGAARADRDMIEGRRELALMIFEMAGFGRDKLPDALVFDDLSLAAKDGRHERDNSDRYEQSGLGFTPASFGRDSDD